MSEGEDIFKIYQTKKPVCDFIRILLMDCLLNISATNTNPLVLLLEVNSHTYISHNTPGTIMDIVSPLKRLLIMLQYCKTLMPPEGATLCSITE